MLVVRFRAGGGDNCVSVGRARYIYASATRGELVLSARCPHRGGPLHLARFDERDREQLVCPWHGRRTSVTRAIDAGIPAVRTGEQVTAVLAEPDDATARVTYVPISDDLRWSAEP